MAAVVAEATTKSEEDKNDSKVEVCDQDEKESSESPITSNENDDNQLICFGGNNTGTEEKLDGLTLDDLNGKQPINN